MRPDTHSRNAGLHRIDGMIWMIMAGVAALVFGAAALTQFHLVWRTFLLPGATVLALLAGQWFYHRHRPDIRLAGALGATAQIIGFAAFAAPLSYLGASIGLPLRDRWLEAADRAAGFDWQGLLAWMDTHATLHPLFRDIYLSLMPQTVVVILALALAGKLARLRVFILSFLIAALVTIVIAAVFPAEGVWGLHHLKAADYPDIVPATRDLHLPIFLGLRDGSYRLLMASGADGIITFPSLHAALALILITAFWPLPVLRWIGLALNVLMLAAIPVDGGHYFTDIIAGLVIAGFCLVAARQLVARFAVQPDDAHAAPVPLPAPGITATAR
jgi:membrane-associated phospholipid phosphatase